MHGEIVVIMLLVLSTYLNQQKVYVHGLGYTPRISKNLAGQFVYNENKRSALSRFSFTNIYSDTQRVYTSGLVDYIINYTLSKYNILQQKITKNKLQT